ncbi:MAG: hypothetical protein KKD44_13590 [Proteobacteria bacterium]|nr:hypothetical protein [Pseudomonadota bacterium]
MDSRRLLKSQKNDILTLINRLGLEPGDFSWVDTPSELNPDKIISRLKYKKTEFFFAFEMDGEVHYAVFSPARESTIGSDYPGTWDRQKICFSNWIKNIIKEESAPDLWKTLPGYHNRSNDRKNHTTYVISEPSDQSPEPDLMAARLNDLLKPNPDTREKTVAPPIKRYYGKA